MNVVNLTDRLPPEGSEESFETLLKTATVRVARIVSHGHASPPDFWYDQAEGEWIQLVQGAARLRIEDEVVELRPGDCLNLPAHTRHRVEWTKPGEPTVWLAVFYREDTSYKDGGP